MMILGKFTADDGNTYFAEGFSSESVREELSAMVGDTVNMLDVEWYGMIPLKLKYTYTLEV